MAHPIHSVRVARPEVVVEHVTGYAGAGAKAGVGPAHGAWRSRGRSTGLSEAASRLARSRRAITERMERASQGPQGSGAAGWSARVGTAASTWWRDHPVHLGLQLATPLVSACAGRWPWPFLAVAAASGALVVATRPWRLLAVSGVGLAVARFSQLPALLLSALAAVGSREMPVTQTQRLASPPWRNVNTS